MKKPLTALSLLALVALACIFTSGAPSAPTPTSEAIPLPVEPTEPPLVVTEAPPAPAPTAEPTAAPTLPTAPLAQTGPWAVFSKPDGLYAANLDGSGITKIFEAAPYLRAGTVAPRGGRFTVITASDEGGDHNRTLHIVHLPDGRVEKSIPLTGAQTEPGPNNQPGDELYQMLWVLGDAQWSPDGGQLAFEAAIDGPSSDLYLYTVSTGEVKRLTTGPAQDYSPSWSPDGKYIVHFGVETFGTGAGYSMTGAWVTQVSDNSIRDLYKPDSYGEFTLGWLDSETVAIYSFHPSCATKNLRAVNARTLKTTSLWKGDFSQDRLAFDPASGATLLITDDLSSCNSANQPAGTYLIQKGGTISRVSDDPGGIPVWSAAAGMFFFEDNYAVTGVKLDGTLVPMPPDVSENPFFAPDGQTCIWRGEGGAELFRGGETVHLTDASLRVPTKAPFPGGRLYEFPSPVLWSADSQNMLFVGDDNVLYAALASNGFVPLPASDAGETGGGLFLLRVEP